MQTIKLQYVVAQRGTPVDGNRIAVKMTKCGRKILGFLCRNSRNYAPPRQNYISVKKSESHELFNQFNDFQLFFLFHLLSKTLRLFVEPVIVGLGIGKPPLSAPWLLPKTEEICK